MYKGEVEKSMGFLKTLKEKVFKQDLENYENAGMIFAVRLLFEDRCRMPMPDDMDRIMDKHLGNTKMLSYSDEMTGFVAKDYKVHYEDDDDIPVQLLIMKCVEIDKPVMEALDMSQLWSCPDGEEILKSCKYQVVANDMLASGLDHKERAEMLVNELNIKTVEDLLGLTYEDITRLKGFGDKTARNILAYLKD